MYKHLTLRRLWCSKEIGPLIANYIEKQQKGVDMLVSENLRIIIEKMFVPPVDFDYVNTEMDKDSENPELEIKVFKGNQIVYYHNYMSNKEIDRDITVDKGDNE